MSALLFNSLQTTSGSSVSENSLEEVLSVRGGGLFGGRKKEEDAESADANAGS